MRPHIFMVLLLIILLLPATMGKIVETHATYAVIQWNTNGSSEYDIYLREANQTYSLYDRVYVGNSGEYEVKFVQYYSNSWHYAHWNGQNIVVPSNATLIRYSIGGLKENTKYFVKVVANGKAVMEDSFTTLQSMSSVKKNPMPVYLSILTIAAVVLLALFFVSLRDPKENRSAYFYILPALLGLVLLTFYPVIYGFYLSFTDYRMGREFSAHFIGLKNYFEIFQKPDFYLVFNTTIIWTVANVTLHVLLGLSLALVLNRKIRGKAAYRTILLLPWAIPGYISVLVWRGMFDPNYGFVNYILGTNINWLGEFPYAFIAVLIANVWLGFPFMMMMFLGGLQSIPKELYEAADIDGFTRWQKFRYITLPMLKPVMTPAVLLGFIWTFNMFNVIYLMTGGGPQAAGNFSAGQTDLLITFVYNRAFRDWMIGYAAAYSVVIFLIILSFSVAYTRIASSEYKERKRKFKKSHIIQLLFLFYSLIYLLGAIGVFNLPFGLYGSATFFALFLTAFFLTRFKYRESFYAMLSILIADFIFAIYQWLQTDIRAYGFYRFNILSLLDIFVLVYLWGMKEEYSKTFIHLPEINRRIIKAENIAPSLTLILASLFFGLIYIGSFGLYILASSLLFIAYLFYPRNYLNLAGSSLISSISLFFALYYGNLFYLLPLIFYVPVLFMGEEAFVKYVDHLLSYGYLAFMLVFVLIPVWWMVWISLNPHNTLFATSYSLLPQGATFEHYIYAIQKTPFLLWLRNSIIVATGTTILGIILAITAAYGYSRFDFKGKGGTMMLFLVVQMFPGVIVLIPYYLIMYNLGLIDTFAGLIIAYSVTAIPLIVWMSKGFFDSIPKSLDEAAMVDGCTRFQAFRKVVLPLATPGISVAALFSFITAWNEFVLAYTFMSEDHYTLPVGIMQFIGLTGSTSSQWGVFAAVSIMVSIPVVIVFLSLQRYLISGMTSGSVKG